MDKEKPLPNYMLSLRDPADETNDLGRKGISIKHVQATLRHLDHTLASDMMKNTKPSLLAPLVGDVFSMHKKRRNKLVYQGGNVLDSFAHTAKSIRDEENNKQPSEEQRIEEKPHSHTLLYQ